MISVLLQCFSKQEHLTKTLPLWLAQEGIDFEIILGIGPGIKIPQVPNTDNFKGTTIVPLEEFKFCGNYNKILNAAHGDVLCISYCDMILNTPLQLKRMYEHWSPMTMVTDKVFRYSPKKDIWERNYGTYLDIMMVAREQVVKAGGWYEGYDSPDSFAHEDGDLVATMLENCLTFVFMQTNDKEAIRHIHHESPDMTDPVMQARHKRGTEIFFSRHKEGIMALYAKQILGRGNRLITL